MDDVFFVAQAAHMQASDHFNEEIAELRAENAELSAALAAREAQLRLVLIVAYNTTVNANGGIGTGDKAADAMLARLNTVLMEPLPAWTRQNDVVALPPLAPPAGPQGER